MTSIAESTSSLLVSPQFSLTVSEQIGEALSDFAFQLLKPVDYSMEQILRCFTPIHPGEFGNHDSELVEVIIRVSVFVLCSLLSPLSIALWGIGGLFDFVGTCLKSTPYTYLQGAGPEKINTDASYRFFSLNACLFWGGLPIPFGGVMPAHARIEQIGDLIHREDADFVVFQEVSYGPALALWDKIKNKYAHGFTRIAPNPWKMETCLFVASKYPIIGQPQFIPLPTNTSFNRGLFYFETKNCWVCTTHLESGDGRDSVETRAQQMKLIVKKLNQLGMQKPCVLLGDLNIARTGAKDDEYTNLIQKQFHDPYGSRPFSQATATCTNRLIKHNCGTAKSTDPDFELIDYVLIDKEFEKCVKKIQLVPTFDLSSPATMAKAPTDHRGLRTQISFT